MIDLDFVLPDAASALGRSWSRSLDRDASRIDSMELRYKMFFTRVEFTVGEVTLLSKFSFEPLADIALGMLHVLKRLRDAEEATLGFTERDEILRFTPTFDSVRIASSTRPEVVAMARKAEIVLTLSVFVEKAAGEIVKFNPNMMKNANILRLRNEA